MLNSEFRKLYSYLDKLLLKFIKSNSTLAYSKLHIIKNHPEFNKEYFPNKDRLIKSEIRIEIISRINFCRKAIKEAIPNLFKLPEGMDMTEERLEILTDAYPQYYLNMFEKTRKGN